MAKIVWLASYPRSGNTWLRFMLGCLLKGSPVVSSAEVSRLLPDIHDGIRGDALFGKRTTIIKTHWVFDAELPLREDAVGVIHLVRNPLDVLESNQNYALTRSGEVFAQMSQEERQTKAYQFAEDYIANGGHPRFAEFGFGSWEHHTLSWASPRNEMPKLALRYEDLLADPMTQLRRIAQFLRLEKTDREIAAAIEASSIAAMRRIETREIEQRIEGVFFQTINAAAYDAGQRFVGSDRSRFFLTSEQRQRALARFAGLMRRLGYATSFSSGLASQERQSKEP